MKKNKDGYVLNFKNKNEWEVITFTYSDTDLIVYYINLDKHRKTTIKKLKKILAVKTIKGSDRKVDHYLIDPTQQEFETLQGENIFTKAATFTRIE